jgi:hypothetical protein
MECVKFEQQRVLNTNFEETENGDGDPGGTITVLTAPLFL